MSAPKVAARLVSTKTRFVELGYRQDAPGVWRVVAVDSNASVGPHYRTRSELFADLERYATVYGCLGTSAPKPAALPEKLTEKDLRSAIYFSKIAWASATGNPESRALVAEVLARYNSHADLRAVSEKVNDEWHLAHAALKRGDRDAVYGFLCAWQDAARVTIAKAEGGAR